LPRLICLALAAYTVALYFSIITSNSAIFATTRLIALHARGSGWHSTCYPPPTFGEWTIAEPNDWIKQACRERGHLPAIPAQ
jgi:phospholipase C